MHVYYLLLHSKSFILKFVTIIKVPSQKVPKQKLKPSFLSVQLDMGVGYGGRGALERRLVRWIEDSLCLELVVISGFSKTELNGW